MSIQRRNAPTLDGVLRAIAAFERHYDVETSVFTLNDRRSAQVDEDDATEWLYLIEQANVLAESAVGNMYATASEGVLLHNVPDPSELLAA